jgi:hypothetical protein
VARGSWEDLVALSSPSWASDGRRLAFVGLSASGYADLYIWDVEQGRLERLTNDRYLEATPSWSPTRDEIVFASDRTPFGQEGSRNLYLIDVATRDLRPLTFGRWVDRDPDWAPDGKRVVFASDRGGTLDLYVVDREGAGYRASSFAAGAMHPRWYARGGVDEVVFTAYENMGYDIYRIALPNSAPTAFTLAVDATVPQWRWEDVLPDPSRFVERSYEREFGLDFAGGALAFTEDGGRGEGAQIVFSDLLGDHLFALSVSSFQGSGAGNVLASLNGNIFYLNQSRRVNWGAGVFRVAGTFAESDLRQLYEEQSTGVYGIARYPLSRFTRIEGQTTLEYSNRDDFANELVRGTPRRRGLLTGNYLVLVGDNALWLETGPIDGTRWNLTGGVVSDATHGAFENWLGQVDARRYIRTSQQAAIALRAFGYVSEGARPRAIQLAGSWMLRGYPRFSLSGTHAWLANAEWRFPIANFVTVGFPFGAVRFPPVRGALFVDAGQAWNRGEYRNRVLGSTGIGFRMSLVPGFVLRLDVGRRFLLAAAQESPADRAYLRRRFVDLFFGYDY